MEREGEGRGDRKGREGMFPPNVESWIRQWRQALIAYT